ncbi:MAG TPA: alternative ribosome rescue aminoacyl-tRNA hydrolase ArfB [Syntrophobacteraceae bacterium]|nr:alternative ribosome rescue aminoacyl-tRNA hydrolase ArfB [Syntrophobacteraceae bacterium]
MLIINERISIPEDELDFTASRSSGPGGQHVNKVSSKVILWFDLDNSPSLSDEDKALIKSRLRSRIGKDGVLRVVSQSTRSQAANRERAILRFTELLQDALKRVPIRRRRGVSRAAKERRLEEKRQHSILKSRRSEKASIED